MDLFTLGAALLVALSLLGADAVIHSGSVAVEVATAPQLVRMDKMSIDQPTLEAEFEDQLNRIATTHSVVSPPEIRSSREQGIGMALAQAAKVESIAYAMKSQLGYRPDTLRLALYVENSQLRGLVSGNSPLVGSFRHIMVPMEGEGVVAFVRRCALWGGSQLAPYSSALFLMQLHSADRDFRDVLELAAHAKGLLPPMPLSADRSLFDNLIGIVALFQNDPRAAKASFEAAIASDPANSAAVLNAAFTDLQLDDCRMAAQRMQRLVEQAPPENKVLLATAYATWGTALLGLHDVEGADQLLARSVEINPDGSAAIDLWAEAKEVKGDQAAAAELRQRALATSDSFENYAEVAALYFHLSWRNNEAVTRSKFLNPEVVTFH
jgi:tetratricopeptide (TPR) repeat protein